MEKIVLVAIAIALALLVALYADVYADRADYIRVGTPVVKVTPGKVALIQENSSWIAEYSGGELLEAMKMCEADIKRIGGHFDVTWNDQNWNSLECVYIQSTY